MQRYDSIVQSICTIIIYIVLKEKNADRINTTCIFYLNNLSLYAFLVFMNVAVNSLHLRMSCFDDAIE